METVSDLLLVQFYISIDKYWWLKVSVNPIKVTAEAKPRDARKYALVYDHHTKPPRLDRIHSKLYVPLIYITPIPNDGTGQIFLV